LEKGADVDTEERERTALHEAVRGGHETVVKLLLEKGANVATKDSIRGRTSLHYAAWNG
jgi:ankyrin repeat protein